jgi:hypothetical protein
MLFRHPDETYLVHSKGCAPKWAHYFMGSNQHKSHFSVTRYDRGLFELASAIDQEHMFEAEMSRELSFMGRKAAGKTA